MGCSAKRTRHVAAPAASDGSSGADGGPAAPAPTSADPAVLAAAAEGRLPPPASAGPSSLVAQQQQQQQPAGAAVVMAAGRVLGGGKYTIEEVLGAGSNAVAYRARRPDGSEVALKALSLRSLRAWKQLELFEREAKTLESLSHPGIPRYVDYFEEDDPNDRAFVLVQEVVRGRSLADMLRAGQRATEQEVVRIAGEMLGVLEYLSSLRPPVIHRDVKPDNIILEGGAWGGRVYLVDFGGVQAVANAGELSGLGSTIVGTFGYMAPEQFRGAADTASDLYGLGATLLYLLSGQPPGSFPQERMRINWRAGLGAASARALESGCPGLAGVLDGLLEPLAEDRLTAAEARRLLAGKPLDRGARASSGFARKRAAQRAPMPPPASIQEAYMQQVMGNAMRPPVPVSKPAGTRVELERTRTRLDVVIPPRGFTADTAFTGVFAVAWNAFVAFWTVGALASGGLLFALFSAPFWFAGAQLAKGALGGALTRERFAVGPNKWRLGQQLAVFGQDGKSADFLDGQNERVQEGSTRDLSGARVVTIAFINGVPQTAIEVLAGVNRHRFGEGLEMVEQQWLVQEINDQIAELQGRDLDLSALPPPDMPQVVNDSDRRDDDDDDRWRSR